MSPRWGPRAGASSNCSARDSEDHSPRVASVLCPGPTHRQSRPPGIITPRLGGSRGTASPTLRSRVPRFPRPVEGGSQARRPNAEKPAGGRGGKREAQGARSRGHGRETAGGAHARAGTRGGGRGLREPAGRGRPGAGLEAGRGRGQGRASTPGGGAGRGGDALAGWGRRGRGGGGSVPGFRPCFPLSFHLRPPGLWTGSAGPSPGAALLLPLPPSARGEPGSLRTVRAPRLGHGWVSAPRRCGGRAGLRLSRFLSAPVRTRRGRRAGCGTGGRRSGPGRARRPGFRAPPRGARIAEGRSATASPSPWGAPP